VQLPILFPAPRFYLQLLFVCMSALGLAALEFGHRERQRRTSVGQRPSPKYSIERR